MRRPARIQLLHELRDLGITEYSHTDKDGSAFSVTFGPVPVPVVTAEADEDEQAEKKLPPLPKDAARLAYQLGNQ